MTQRTPRQREYRCGKCRLGEPHSAAYHSEPDPVNPESAAQPEGSSTGGLSSPSQAVQSAESNDHLG